LKSYCIKDRFNGQRRNWREEVAPRIARYCAGLASMIDGGESLPRRVLHIPLHFEAGDQFDIAGGAGDAGFPVAQGFIAWTKLYPFRLKLVARLLLFVRAPFLLLLRAELALPRDIEFRRGVRDRGWMQGSQNNDRQVNQHFCFPSCFVIH
jgi:hypothetical protein